LAPLRAVNLIPARNNRQGHDCQIVKSFYFENT
jgi:hypothetical protein